MLIDQSGEPLNLAFAEEQQVLSQISVVEFEPTSGEARCYGSENCRFVPAGFLEVRTELGPERGRRDLSRPIPLKPLEILA